MKRDPDGLTYVFDLDGTLCDTPGTDYDRAVPNRRRIEQVQKLARQGHTIKVETARGSLNGVTGDLLKLTHDQLKQWRVPVRELRLGRKAVGDIYVDDKGVNDRVFFNDGRPLERYS